MSLFEERQWQVKEYPFRPSDLLHTETIFTIGNGLVGVRGSFEEGFPGETPSTLAAGVFNHKAGVLVPELAALPNWLSLRITVNGETFRLDEGRILGFERTLDMRTAVLRRGVLWLSPGKLILRLAFERFASLDNPHLLALRVLVQVLSEGTHDIQVYDALDGSVTNPDGTDHWERRQDHAQGERLFFSGVTDQSGYVAAMHSSLLVEGADPVWAESTTPKVPAHTATFTLQHNQKAWITKLVALHTTRDTNDPTAACAQTLSQALQAGYPVAKQQHEAAWEQYWSDFDVQIEGDEVAQQAIRFNLYHLLIAVPTADERVSIGAKTLSGYGYKGHVFWDTELFMLPPITLGAPALAKRLLMYRYHNLPGARAKAQEAGCEGALFPWESTDTGVETTPRWANDLDYEGNRIRIWTGDNEQHISTDIAYAILQFWRWTGDNEWFLHYGAEIVLDTARFWASRVEMNAEKQRYELRMQIGPDEYHENVDNSVFTNRMVRWHMEQALGVWAWLQANAPDHAARLGSALDMTPSRLEKWTDVAARIYIPMQEEDGAVLEQFEGFFDRLKPINLEDYTPRTTNMDWILGHRKTQVSRVIKQADVVMLLALLGHELGDRAFLKRNWDVYYPVVDHGSSLSPSIHAWVAARLGDIEEAYRLFIHSATIDLEDHKGNVRDGIHGASCGGVWQALVFGFCGLQAAADGLKVEPRLPAHWRRVSFKVWHHGRQVTISIPQE
jgi:kojibiose phosphorylase